MMVTTGSRKDKYFGCVKIWIDGQTHARTDI